MNQTNDTIWAKKRPNVGKGAARRLRAQGLTPGVMYGPSTPSEGLTLDPKRLITQLQTFRKNHMYVVQMEEGETFKAFIKNVHQDPVTRKLLHVDLYRVDSSKPIRVDVPIELVGKPVGLLEGGLLSQILHHIGVQCLPDDVPAHITVDVSELALGHTLHLSDLKLPPGIKLTSQGDEAVAAVVEPDTAAAAPAAEVATPTAATPVGKK